MILFRFALPLVLLGAFANTQAATERGDYQIVPEACTPQKPRFPKAYAKFPAVRLGAMNERYRQFKVDDKIPDSGLSIEARLQEIDLTGNGTCDLIVIIGDLISTGGDSAELATLYLADKGKWLRIGARSAKSDLPSNVDTMHAPTDANFEFSEYLVMRRPEGGPTYLIAWRSGRVTNGFMGFRIYEIDPSRAELRLVDKWNGKGAEVYAAFKNARYPGNRWESYGQDAETEELHELCKTPPKSNPGLTTACANLKR